MKRCIFQVIMILATLHCFALSALATPPQAQATMTYRSCWQILLAGAANGDGLYSIDPDGGGGNPAFDVYCDMTTDGGGWTHVITAGDASVLVDGAVGIPTSRAFKLSNTVINSLLDSERLMLINFGNGKSMQLKLGRSSFTTASQGILFRYGTTGEFQSLCAGTLEYNKYWFYARASCSGTYPSITCTCQSSGYENAVYSTEGFNNLNSSGFWPATGWSDSYKIYVRETRLNSRVIGKGAAYGFDVSQPMLSGFINNQFVWTPLREPVNHVVMTYNKDAGAGNLKLYVNGSLKTARTLTDAIPTNTEKLRIGDWFTGIIDEVTVYNSALTDVEVKQRYDRVSEDLAARWKLDTGHGKIAYDLSGNANDGTLKNSPQWVDSTIGEWFENWEESGNALDFDGISNYIDCGATSSLTGLTPQAMAIEAWVYNRQTIQTNQTDLRTILAQRPSSGNGGYSLQYGYVVGGGIDNYVVRLAFAGGYTGQAIREIKANRWYHIVGSFRSNVATIFINGEAQTTTQSGSGATTSTDPIMIGRQGNYASSYDYHRGMLDEISVYKRYLPADEVKARYERYSWGLVSRWDFDETSGNTLVDSGIGQNDGTLMNGPTRANSTLGTEQHGTPTGKMLTFDGNDDYIDVVKPLPASLRPERGVTLESWVRVADYSNAKGGEIGGIIASQWDADTACYSMMIDYRDNSHGGSKGGVHFQVGSKSGYWTTSAQGTTSATVPINVWTHIAAVADIGYEYAVYIDGRKVTNWTPRNDLYSSDNCHLTIGWSQYQNSSNRYFNGSIENARIYGQALYSQAIFWKANLIRQSDKPLANIGFPLNDSTFQTGEAIPFTTTGTSDLYGLNPGINAYFWDFGDGSPILKRESAVAVSYSQPGLKKVKLWAIDNDSNPSILKLGQGLIYININQAGTLFNRLDRLKNGKNSPSASLTTAPAATKPAYRPALPQSEESPPDLTQRAAFWALNEASGTTTVDGSGNGNTGTVFNARWVDSPLNEFMETFFYDARDALYFDGVTDYVEVSSSTSLSPTSQISLEAWVRSDPRLFQLLGQPGYPALSCAQIKRFNSLAGNGIYWLDPDSAGAVDPFEAYCDMTTAGGGWTLLLNLDTSDGHVMWWADSLWTNQTTYGTVATPFDGDLKSPAWNTYSGATMVLLVVHTQGQYVGWKQFRKANGNTMYTVMQGGDNTLLGSSVLDSSVGSLWSGERLVRLSTALYANHCTATGGNCTTGSSGSPDGDRISSSEAQWSDNYGGGLGNWHDMNYCCSGQSYGSGKSCNGSAFRTTTEAQAGWCPSYNGGVGYFGSDIYGPATCNQSNSGCGNSNWASASGYNYDYALFIREEL